MSILDTPMQENDADAATIRDYLKALLLRLWEQGEGFDGKRPFGNSGWNTIFTKPSPSGSISKAPSMTTTGFMNSKTSTRKRLTI